MLPHISSNYSGTVTALTEGLRFDASERHGPLPRAPLAPRSGVIPWSQFVSFRVAKGNDPTIILETVATWFFVLEPPGWGPVELWATRLRNSGVRDLDPDRPRGIAPAPVEENVRQQAIELVGTSQSDSRTRQGQIAWMVDLPTDRRWGTGRRGPGDFASNGVLAVSSDLVTTGWAHLDEGGVTQMDIVAFALSNGERVKTVSVDPPFGAMRSSGASFWSGPNFIGLSAHVERQAESPSGSVEYTLFDLTSLQVNSWSGVFGSHPLGVSTDGRGLLTGGGPFGVVRLDGTEVWSKPRAFGRIRGIGQTSGSLNSISTSRLEEFTHIVEFGSPGGAAGYDVNSGQELWKESIELAPAMVDFARTSQGGLLLCPTPDAVFGKGGSTTAVHVESGQKIWTREGFVRAVNGVDDVVVTRQGEAVIYLNAFSTEPTADPPPPTHDCIACIIDGQLMVEVDKTWLTAQVPGQPDCLMGRAEVVAYGDLLLCVTTTKLIALHAG